MKKSHLDDHPLRVLAGSGVLSDSGMEAAPRSIHVRSVIGGILILGGIVAVLVGWVGISGTLDPGKQMPYLISGGIGGAMAVAVGVTLLISNEHVRDRESLDELYGRLESLETMVDEVEQHLVRLRHQVVEAASGEPAPRRRSERRVKG